jgi:hypothetical protein
MAVSCKVQVLTLSAPIQNLLYIKGLLTNSGALFCERTIPTERPPLVGEVSDNFCIERGVAWLVWRIPYGRNLGFLDRFKGLLDL